MLDSASFFLTVTQWHLELSRSDYAYGQLVRQLSLSVVKQSTKLQDQEMGILPEDRRKGSHVSFVPKKERKYRHQQRNHDRRGGDSW